MHKFIKDIDPGQFIDDIYMITQPVLRSTTRGDFYIAMFISDKTGKINGRMWQATEEIYNSLPKEGFVKIKAKSEVYQGALQIIVNDIQVIDSDDVNTEDYLPRTEKSIKEMFNQLSEHLEKIENSDLRNLIKEFLNDTDLMRNFCKSPAATSVHHNYLGGLLEHTLNMMNVADAVFPFYPNIQKDLVIAGILLHDIGKTEELSYKMAFTYTDTGQLLGHITKSAFMIKEKADALAAAGTPIEQTILDSLLHIVLSHHGQYEFGSPKIPATAEAFMVSYIDNMDAKINQVSNLIADANNGDDTWTSWQNTLQTRIYKNRPLNNDNQ